MDLTPEDIRDVLHALDSSGLDELHLELADLTLTVRREGAVGWTAEQQVLRRPVVEGTGETGGTEVAGGTEVTAGTEVTGGTEVTAGRGAAAGAAEPAGAAAQAAARAVVADGLVPVHPPLLGTFYRAPQPGAPPFVELGDEVEQDTVVGIVETMKMMTPVHAGVRGAVVEFRTGNGEFADADAVLLVVDPAAVRTSPGEAAW